MREKSGSTAAVALVAGTTLFTANIGDSTVLLVKGDGRVVVLSCSHNTLNEEELGRLVAEGARLKEVPRQGGTMYRIYDAAGVQGLMCSRWVVTGGRGVWGEGLA
jgi:serine/threonine protein phosphatase PrpC